MKKHPLTKSKISKVLLVAVLAFVLCALMAVLAGCNDPGATTELGGNLEFVVPEGPADETFGLNGETPTALNLFKYEEYEDGTIIITGTYTQINELTKVVIPAVIDGKKVSRVGESAFATLYNLEEIVFSGYIVDVQQYAFRDCWSLKTIKLSEHVLRLHEGAFQGCKSISDLSFIVPSVKVLGARAFEGCNGLKKVTIPSTIDSIGGYTFLNCEYLDTVEFPEGIEEIPERMFQGCRNLKFTAKDGVVDTIDVNGKATKAVIIPDSVKKIGDFAFMGCNFKAITLGANITSIGQSVFANNVRLDTINMPITGTVELGKEMFMGCKAIKTINVKAGSTLESYCKEWADTASGLGGYAAVAVNVQ